MLLIVFVFITFSFGLDVLNNEGRDWGERIKGQYQGSGVETKLMRPLTEEKQEVINPAGKGFKFNPPLCGRGEVKNKRIIMRITTSGGSVSIQFSSDGKVLDRSYSFSAVWLCPGGYCPSDRNNCVALSIRGGNLISRSAGRLDACVDASKYPQPPTFIGSKLINDLVEDYKSRGIKVSYADVAVDGNTAYYYGGELEGCGEEKELPPAVGLADNPYEMTDRALTYYFACDPKTDPTCKALKRLDDNAYSTAGSGLVSCSIKREFPSPPASRTDERVCVPNQKVYAYGYNEANPYCYQDPNDKWGSYSSSFWLECLPDGSGYVLKGWGYWEGAPCGGAKAFPPAPQVVWKYPMNTNFDWTQIGRLSVNKRRGGENVIELDRISEEGKECVSNEPTPFTVWAKNQHFENEYNILEIKVDNAPACNYFRFKVQGLGPEQIVNGCEQYEKQNCVLWNEWWVDANGNRIQVLKEGQPTEIASRCEPVQWSNTDKQWVNNDTYQTPPENCVGIPKTCREVRPGIIECREWWEKIREYKCSNTEDINPDLSLAQRAMDSATYDPQTGEFSFSMKEGIGDCAKNGQCTSLTETITKYVCGLTGKEYETIDLCDENCYRNIACSSEVYAWVCAVGGQYATESECRTNCREPGTCEGRYFCPLTGGGYTSADLCKAECNNCIKQGGCSKSVKYFCTETNREYPSLSTCQNECIRNGTCDKEYYCTTGRLQGNLCVTNPSCPSGTTFNPSTGKCERIPLCPYPGGWNDTLKACVTNPSSKCIPTSLSCTVYNRYIGYKYIYGRCRESSCWGYTYGYYGTYYYYVSCSAYIYNNTLNLYAYAFVRGGGNWWWDMSRASRFVSCPASVSHTLRLYPGGYYTTVRLNISLNRKLVCPSGYTLQGSICRANGYCPPGYTYSNGRCITNPSCPSGFSFNGRVCVKPANVRYRCSLTGKVYNDAGVCQAQCVRNGECLERVKFVCSLNGREYRDEASCRVNCYEEIANCCIVRNYCVESGQFVSDCSRCQKPAQCSPKYRYRCPLTNNVYYDNTVCQQNCRQDGNCGAVQRTVVRYLCTLTFEKYESFEACQNVCKSSYNCLTGEYKGQLWRSELKTCYKPSCIVKYFTGGKPKYDFKLVECVQTGENSWSCPAGGGQVVEGCSCELRSGLAIPTALMGVIYDALNDRTCD